MQNKPAWLAIASMLLLACNNAAPLADSADTSTALDVIQHPSCEVAESTAAVQPEETRGLYAAAAGLRASERESELLTTYAGRCLGGYGLQIDLDVFMQDDPVSTEHDPGRGKASLLLRADFSEADVELRLCGLTLPPRYVYATSAVTQLQLPDATWDKPSMPTWKTRIHAARDAELELDAFPMLLGIALTEPAASWPTFEQTAVFECGMQRAGSACFTDDDGDGEPGLTMRFQTSGDVTDAPYPACEDWHYAAPSSEPQAWLSAADTAPSRVFVGLRTALQLFPRFDETCSEGAGEVQAADIVTRVLDCQLEDGTRCSPQQASVLDARAPSFHVLAKAETPPESFRDSRKFVDEALDRSASAGSQLHVVRLPDTAAETCAPVQAVFAR